MKNRSHGRVLTPMQFEVVPLPPEWLRVLAGACFPLFPAGVDSVAGGQQ